mmetsp:Transcript_14497/g.21830  ORF Transcript_14497/g.21830 Transcript_14497/m.21830 type:complete len:341 (-) Transcript_14497:132-1154(-)
MGASTESYMMGQILYIPALVTYSVCLFLSFTAVLNLSIVFDAVLSGVEHFLMTGYTVVTRRCHLPKHKAPKQFCPSISFMGGGQLWMFAIGVGTWVYRNYDIENIKFFASSSGIFAAVPLACGLDPYEWCKCDWGKCMTHFESRGLLGCLYDSKEFYFQLWDEYLPPDAHTRCSGRLYISVTQYPSMRNKVVSHFATREELIHTIVGSMCLPFAFIRDFPVQCSPEIGLVVDGGFSNDAPCLDSYTITVSALHREADISPISLESSSCEILSENDCEHSGPISLLDIIRTPAYSRVWEVGAMGQAAAEACRDFERHEWQNIRKTRSPGPNGSGCSRSTIA